jgi:hypothetical protein
MKRFLKQLFCNEKGKLSVTRIFVVIPVMFISLVEFSQTAESSVSTAWGALILIFAGCFGLSFNRFIDNGCIEQIINALCAKIKGK